MSDTSPVLARLRSGRLTTEEWTHAAHVDACRAVLAERHDPAWALIEMRQLICAHNARVGVDPARRGYHETITRYYVGAVAALMPADLDTLLADERLGPHGFARYWSPEALARQEARDGWVEPDREPLWFSPPGVAPDRSGGNERDAP